MNSIIYIELSIGFNRIEELEAAINQIGIKVLEIPREALFLAGKIFLEYRKNKGTKNSTLPDFFIGAHAIVNSLTLVTRDTARFKTYFPKLRLIAPEDNR
ncbi:PIN domain-containing protein [bacterium]|nr:PIN domain-containing protein [bacterium]